MLCCRRISAIGTPASPCFRMPTIWLSVNRDFRMGISLARKVYLRTVYQVGKLTDRLCANDSGVSTVIRTALRDQTRTVRLRHGFTSSLTEGEARSFLRYANRQGFERLATALRLISAGKVSSDAEWRTSPCSGS